MLLIYILATCLMSLLVFSLSRDKGKHTKYARKNSPVITPKEGLKQSFTRQYAIEIN